MDDMGILLNEIQRLERFANNSQSVASILGEHVFFSILCGIFQGALACW